MSCVPLPQGAARLMVLRRRREPTGILGVPFVLVALLTAGAHGHLRCREPADVALVVLAGVALDAALRRRAARPAGQARVSTASAPSS